jgi:hypothetical protein
MEGTVVSCPGCGLVLPPDGANLDADFNAAAACRALMYELTYYTLALGDASFIHQLAVDTYAVQHAGLPSKPISTAFGLAGLYLVFERGFTGRQVQRVHMALAGRRKDWPRFERPHRTAAMTVRDVVNAPLQAKDAAIRAWGEAVWEAWREHEERIALLLEELLGIV